MTTPSTSGARRWRVEYTVFAVMTGLLVLAPLVVYPVTLMQCLCLALFACAFNLLIGYVGLLSFGHAMFLGGAGYAAAHAAKIWGLTPELAIVFGTACAAAAGLVVGWLAIRRQGIYFSMITLGLIEGLTKVFYPPAANTVVFALMALVLLIRPAGLFGKAA